MATRRWKCLLCGYIHEGDEAPEKCPVCGADKVNFTEVDEQGKEIKEREEQKETDNGLEETQVAAIEAATPPQEQAVVEEKKNEDTQAGGTLPEKESIETNNPVTELTKKEEKEVEELKQDATGEVGPKETETVAAVEKEDEAEKTKEKPSWSFLGWLGGLILKLHLHPIAVHTPNGVLPMAVLFMVLAIYFNYQSFELPSFYGLAFVLAVMPAVMITGYIEWQMRYRGAKSFLFITKIFFSIVVLVTVSTLVIWRIVDPAVAAPESPERLTYLIVGLVALGAAGITGHLGGKLVFARAGG